MDNKTYKDYLNEIKTKVSSLEATVTEAHSLSPDDLRISVEGIMASLTHINTTLDSIYKYLDENN